MNRNSHFSIKLSLLIGCIFVFASIPQVNAVSTYDHCYKEAMLGEAGNYAEREARTACRKKFPAIESKGDALPMEVIKKLQIDAGFGWGIFSGSIYNSSPDFRITQLTLSMTPIHNHPMEMMKNTLHETKQYTVDLNLAPLSKGALSLTIDANDTHFHDFKWKILQVLGHKVK